MATVDIHYVHAALNCAVRSGLEAQPLLADSGIDPQLLGRPGARAPGESMTRLVQLIWAALDDEFMGCTEHRCKPGVFALMTQHALHYESLEAALQQGIQLYNLFTDDIRMRLQRRGERALLEIEFARPELDPDAFFREFWLVIWHRFASWLIGEKIALGTTGFDYPEPPHAAELKHMFPGVHRFARDRLSLSFNAGFLAKPPVRTRRDLALFLRRSPADLITIPGRESSFEARIRSELLHHGREVLECPSFEDFATRFNISAQTLRRRLRAEGTSYPRIKDQVRRDLAIEKLLLYRLSVTEVARQLGFSEPRSFSRAFRQWTGLTPTAYLELRKEAGPPGAG
ncbi:transcriptional regulator [Marinobacterium nitratireducens]|uniref:Transcriptional regulator n=1 Tax=Marinobacterium nitratireducens TaxID=518897 RepID=A0A917ZI45_9GAMM|nr:AraC family transcriptional regulator [Marinobacterium nitratireducens]GGO83643.1 transcriptional regulator [Marinobacterium nitratireducens]